MTRRRKNERNKIRLKGHSLSYALILSVIIFSLLLGLILKNHLRWKLDKNYVNSKQVIDNVESGINLYLGMNMTEDSLSLDLFGDGRDKVHLEREPWGLFDLLSCTAKKGHLVSTATVLIGSDFKDEHRFILTLADKNSPLSLAGRTEVIGPVRLPEAGVKRAYIEGTTFQGEELIQGKISTSASRLPEIDRSVSQRIESLLVEEASSDYWSNDIDSVQNPFHMPAVEYYSSAEIYLDDVHLLGKISIQSATRIIVSPNAHLDQIVLVAPEIEIRSGFEGKVQVFASRGIMIGEEVELEYPSVLAFRGAFDEDAILLHEQVMIDGLILDLSPEGVNSLIEGDDVQIKGCIYGSNRVQLSGEVQGTVYADEFYLKTPSSVYGNHLFNTRLSKIPEQASYKLPSLFSDEPSMIMKWLD